MISEHKPTRSRGFSLIEAVVVIVIMGIVAAIVAVFMKVPVQAYLDTSARAELTDIGDTALRRVSRDIHVALPNSVRVVSDGAGGQFLELLQTQTGGRYLAEDDANAALGNALSFTDSTKLSFTVLGAMPTWPATSTPMIVAGQYVVIYNLGPGLAADAYAGNNRAQIASVSGNTITLSANPFAPNGLKSPQSRFQIVTGPVTYYCNPVAKNLTRYWGYTIAAIQPSSVAALASAGASSALLATDVSACNFSYSSVSNTHTGLINLSMSLTGPTSNAGTIQLVQQVHVDNTP